MRWLLVLRGAIQLPSFPPWIIDLSLAVLAAVTVHLLDRLVLYKDTEEHLDGALNKLKEDVKSTVDKTIASQTTSLATQTRSLAAMIRSGIVQIYPGRADAAQDLLDDLTNGSNTKIDIIGVSLNDFAFAQEHKLGKAWEAINAYVHNGRVGSREKGLRIRILIIDPDSYGAVLRSSVELRESETPTGDLKGNVAASTNKMLYLARKSEERSNETGVTFECRLYRTVPISFLCLVDSVCYIEQYHFWSKREVGTPIPVLKYRRDNESVYPMHAQMEQHFQWIWDKASVDVREFKTEVAVGVDSGMCESSAVNVYTDPVTARERILYLLQHAERQVDIQGISLHSFLRDGDRLLGALEDLTKKGTVNMRILFIDPASSQAKFRSYREALFVQPKLTWEEYSSHPDLHEKSILRMETDVAIRNLKRMVKDVAASAPGANWQLTLEAGTYSTAPHCFSLRVNDSVLVEQYHYGKVAVAEKKTHASLGKDMPVVEFVNKSPDPDVYKEYPRTRWEEMSLRRPFRLLEDHFEFAWTLSKKINLQEVLAERT